MGRKPPKRFPTWQREGSKTRPKLHCSSRSKNETEGHSFYLSPIYPRLACGDGKAPSRSWLTGAARNRRPSEKDFKPRSLQIDLYPELNTHTRNYIVTSVVDPVFSPIINRKWCLGKQPMTRKSDGQCRYFRWVLFQPRIRVLDDCKQNRADLSPSDPLSGNTDVAGLDIALQYWR